MPEPAKYRKRPVEVEAVQWTGENREEVEAFTDLQDVRVGDSGSLYLGFEEVALKGDYFVLDRSCGDYTVPMRSVVFEATYEPVRQPPITQKEAAERLGVHPNTIATMLDDGRLRAVPAGNGSGPTGTCRRVDPASLPPRQPDQGQGCELRKAVDALLFRPERSRPVWRNKHTGTEIVVLDLQVNDHGGFQGGCRQFYVHTDEPPKPGPRMPQGNLPAGYPLAAFLEHWEPTGRFVSPTPQPDPQPQQGDGR